MGTFVLERKMCWCFFGILVVLLAGCDEDEWRTVELDIVSLAATDSIAEGESLDVQFGYFATGEDQFSSHSWETLDPATLQLRVFHRFRESGVAIGAPAFLTSSTVTLESPPARAFQIVAGAVRLEVQGGTEPQPADRLTLVLTENGQPLMGANLQLFGDTGEEIVSLPPTDAQGITRVLGACPGAGSRFWVDSADGRYRARATARWPSTCETPLRLAIPGADLGPPEGS